MKKLKLIITDDENISLAKIVEQSEEIDFVQSVSAFSNPYHALEAVKKETFDVAVLDIEMFGLNGIELAKQMKIICPSIKIIFLTGYSEYAIHAFQVRANGYLLKPISKQDLRNELIHVLDMVPEPQILPIRIQTFGNFEVFVDNRPVEFERYKSKEVLAYLVSRKGSYVSSEELLSALYEDKPVTTSSKSQLRNIIASLNKSLKLVQAEHILRKRRNLLAVDTTSFTCDYYEFLDGNTDALNLYFGEFMSNYSWAEHITGYLENTHSRKT